MKKEISIVCATYNAKETINEFLLSLKEQTNTNYQLIIIDGGSSDNTLDIIKNNLDIIDYWISEPDQGIYDAWNKGISAAKNNWISFVGSDDTLMPNYVESYLKAIHTIGNDEVDYISSLVSLVDYDNKCIRTLGKPFIWTEFKYKMTTAHVGSLHHKNLFAEVGNYDISYKIIGDYELLLRKRNKLKTLFINKNTVKMKVGGTSLSYKAIFERYLAHQQTAKTPKLIAVFTYLRGILELAKFKIELAARKK